MKKILLIIYGTAILCLSIFLFLRSIHTDQPDIIHKKSPDLTDFSYFTSERKKLPQETPSETVSLIAVGDIMLSRGVSQKIRAHDIHYPFKEVHDYLHSADIVFGNLENPITPGREIVDNEMKLRANPGVEAGLREAGFTILSLANNHLPDFGDQGIRDTLHYLNQAGIRHVGAGNTIDKAGAPIFLTIKNIRFAFLAYNDTDVVPPSYEATKNLPGTNFMRIDRMIEAVQAAKKQADIVVVSMHAGDEYKAEPNQSQTNFAHTAIDAGADLVIGHHPHVVQPVEKYKDKYILYSLGNFVFDQMWSEETRRGLVANIIFTKTGVQKIILQPILIHDYSQPKLLYGKEAEEVLKRLQSPLGEDTIFNFNSSNSSLLPTTRKVIYNSHSHSGFVSKSHSQDLDNNNQKEVYNLHEGQLAITEASTPLWHSPQEWWIDDVELADSNNDGVVDINLSVWKTGSFGPSQPFWVTENDQNIKNHFFVLDLMNGAIKPVWQSSNLTAPNCEFRITDIDNDSKNDLIVIEGDYTDWPQCKGKYVALWKWNGWGFSNEWRSVTGTYSNLQIEKNSISVDTF